MKGLTPEQVAEYKARTERGEAVSAFIAGKFWKEYFRPFLEKMQADAAAEAAWAPAKGLSIEKIGVVVCIAHGTTLAAAEVLKEIGRWEKDGEEAAERLRELQKNAE